MNKFRGYLYKTARIMGDINAIKKGTVGKRIARRMAGRFTGKAIFRRIFK
ncbi:hypothetical protein JOD17_003198 [Geomicrobium sediminis]|uniref:Uncharacterized protein n=1 Tax=Geomicrobium sediminis TaxID=1347788 RepID=A0ABS2PFA5_9BACL|nr:hypothetical protein [Geomicrobium sediminis]